MPPAAAAPVSTVVLSIDVGIKNLAYCVFRAHDATVLFWKVFAIVGGDRDVCVNLLRTAEAVEQPSDSESEEESHERPFASWSDIDHVVIEQQPGRNMRVKAVENYLHMFHVMKGRKVTVYSARRKLAGSGMEHRGRSAAQYRARKKASVALCRDWLERHPQNARWKDMVFGKGVKADDAADALNQALSFCGVVAVDRDRSPPRAQVTVRARKPTARQAAGGGRYTASNLKHILCKDWKDASREELKVRMGGGDKKVAAAVRRLYGGDADAAIDHLRPFTSASDSA